jgi:transglutaminase/protease-like cytokinesis protein 3
VKRTTKKKIPKVLKPDEFHTLDEYAKKAPKQYEADIPTLAQYLIKPATTDIEKVRVLFTWVATHVKYDDKAFNSGDYPDYSAENVLLNKRAVCEGYSNILKALCEAAGLEAEKVSGYAKGYGYKVGDKFTDTDHAWNVIKVDNKWRLFDATWASGFGTNKKGRLVSTSRFDPYWFNVNPKAFIFTHLPQQPKWQLTGGSLTLAQYEALPYINIDFFKLGFNPDKIYSDAVLGKVKEFVEAYALEFPTNASLLPYSQSVSRDNEITLQIQSDYAEEIALIDGKTWHYFTKDNNTFTLSHKPTGKQLEICVKINWYDKSFKTIIKYNVTDKKRITAANSTYKKLAV